MPTFVEITPDPFAEQFRKETNADQLEDGFAPGSLRATRSFAHVRRPVRGIQIKDDTYATLQVRTADGRVIPLWDAGGQEDTISPNISMSEEYSNFLLQNVVEQRSEKTQVVQTFGEPFIFFFGEHPRIIQGSGVLLNSEDFNWRAEFWQNYDTHLRGTKCVQNKTRVTLSWDDIVIEGYFIMAQATENAQQPNFVNFNFQIFLTNYANVSRIGANQFPSSELNIDPLALDIPGLNPEPSTSLTATVRELNIANEAGSGQGSKNSLFQTVRDNLTQIATFEGRLEAVFSLAERFLGGNKRVRVPTGFGGGSVFDVDTQIAIASVNAFNREIILSDSSNPDAAFRTRSGAGISGAGKMAVPVKYGKFRDAIDEYIGTYAKSFGSPLDPIDLFSDQEADRDQIVEKVAEVFRQHGVPVDPPAKTISLTSKLSFGAVQVNTSGVVGLAAQPIARTIL